MVQAIPRTVWLDPNRKQLLQWPVEEVNRLRGMKVEMTNRKLAKGQHVEIHGISAAQVRSNDNRVIRVVQDSRPLGDTNLEVSGSNLLARLIVKFLDVSWVNLGKVLVGIGEKIYETPIIKIKSK